MGFPSPERAPRYSDLTNWHRDCSASRRIRTTAVISVLRLTLLVGAIASATFAATLAFAPAVTDLGQRVLTVRTEGTTIISAAAPPNRECGPFAKIVDALRRAGECP